MILKRVWLLLCNDREKDGYNRAVSTQRLAKHVAVATDTRAIEERCFLQVFADIL
jgi:hypothetical protein